MGFGEQPIGAVLRWRLNPARRTVNRFEQTTEATVNLSPSSSGFAHGLTQQPPAADSLAGRIGHSEAIKTDGLNRQA
jgi:hypothetical protein